MNLFITAKKTIITSAMALGMILAQRVVLYMALFNLAYLVKWRFARLAKLFNCYYARKSVINRVIHHRKYATFPICPKGFSPSCSGKVSPSVSNAKANSEVCSKTKLQQEYY